VSDHPLGWSRMVWRKSQRLLNNSTYDFTASDRSPYASRKSIVLDHPMFLQRHVLVWLYLFAVIGLLRFHYDGEKHELGLLFVFALIIFWLMHISEINPQYSFILLPLFAGMAAYGIVRTFTTGSRSTLAMPASRTRSTATMLLSGAAAVGLILMLSMSLTWLTDLALLEADTSLSISAERSHEERVVVTERHSDGPYTLSFPVPVLTSSMNLAMSFDRHISTIAFSMKTLDPTDICVVQIDGKSVPPTQRLEWGKKNGPESSYAFYQYSFDAPLTDVEVRITPQDTLWNEGQQLTVQDICSWTHALPATN
jgi:hypothetical protein